MIQKLKQIIKYECFAKKLGKMEKKTILLK